MQRAITILNIWEGINIRRKNNFLLHIETNCSPLKEEYDDDLTLPEDDDLKKVTMQIKVRGVFDNDFFFTKREIF